MVRLEPDKENGLNKLSAADAFQIRSVAQERLIRRLGKLSDTAMSQIATALADVLDINP